MPPKKNEGTTTKDEKSRQVLPLNASYNGSGPTDRPPQWFISEMEKGIQRIESMIEGHLTKLSVMIEKIVSDDKAIGHQVKGIEGKQREFDDSLAAIQLELDDYKKATEGELRELREQLDDQENRACRQNMRLVGFSQGVEGKNTVVFI